MRLWQRWHGWMLLHSDSGHQWLAVRRQLHCSLVAGEEEVARGRAGSNQARRPSSGAWRASRLVHRRQKLLARHQSLRWHCEAGRRWPLADRSVARRRNVVESWS